jgi:hypothetical protein
VIGQVQAIGGVVQEGRVLNDPISPGGAGADPVAVSASRLGPTDWGTVCKVTEGIAVSPSHIHTGHGVLVLRLGTCSMCRLAQAGEVG